MRLQKRLPRCRPFWHRWNAVRLQDPRDRRPADSMADVPQRADDSGVAPRRILRGHAHYQTPDLGQHARTTASRLRVRPLAGNQLSMPPRIVSGVTIVATAPRRRRPSRCPCTASRRRSSSVRRILLRTCARRMRFSSIRYARASCCRWSSQPTSAANSSRSDKALSTAGESIPPTGSQRSERRRPSNETLRARSSSRRCSLVAVAVPLLRARGFVGGQRMDFDRERRHQRAASRRRTSAQGMVFTAPLSSSATRRFTSVAHAASASSSTSASRLSSNDPASAVRASVGRRVRARLLSRQGRRVRPAVFRCLFARAAPRLSARALQRPPRAHRQGRRSTRGDCPRLLRLQHEARRSAVGPSPLSVKNDSQNFVEVLPDHCRSLYSSRWRPATTPDPLPAQVVRSIFAVDTAKTWAR